MSFPRLPEVVKRGDTIFLNDGLVQLEVQDVRSPEVKCRVSVGGEIRSRVGLNLPGIELGISAFTEEDRRWLRFAAGEGLDAVSQSFVEKASDTAAVREAAHDMAYQQDRERLKALSECGAYVDHIAHAAFAIVLVDHHNWSFDIGQAAAYLQLAAWDLGVSSCLAYFGLTDKLKSLLGIPAELSVEMGISFGYSTEEPYPIKRSGRKRLEEILRKEHW